MKKIIISIALLFIMNITGFSQHNKFSIIPKEEITVNTNTDIFITGETLYYKLNCFNKKTNTLSNISKIAYVFLINDAKEIVFEHKLKLDSGTSNGDYYISTNQNTGNYKLVAYTRWMNNNKKNPFFSKDIYIINPFTKNINEKSKFIKKENSCNIVLKDKIDSILEYKTYKTRSKVSLNFKDLLKGNYSVSVRKVEEIHLIHEDTLKELDINTNNTFYLPEIRGEIISGTVTSKKDNTPIINKTVSLSILGNKTVLKNIKTNSLGKFYFNLNENYKTGELLIQLIDKNNEDYKITLDDFSFNYFNQLHFSNLILNPNIKKWLIQKNTNTQIENSYFNIKKDSIINKKTPKIFYNKSSFEYVLDEYKRFSTVKETFVEVIEGALIKKQKGIRKVVLLSANSKLDKIFTNLELLILIDGIPIQKHETLIDYDPYKIEKMNFIKEPYFYGSNVYNGIINVTTIKGDFSPSTQSHYLKKNIINPVNQKKYYNPDYSNNSVKLARIPDNRTQLLWNPNFNTSENVTFFTSDLKGMYEIVVEGYTNEDNLIKVKKYILVE